MGSQGCGSFRLALGCSGQEGSSHWASAGFHNTHEPHFSLPGTEPEPPGQTSRLPLLRGPRTCARGWVAPRHRPRARDSPHAEVKGARPGAQSLRTRLTAPHPHPPPAGRGTHPRPVPEAQLAARRAPGRPRGAAEPHRGWQGERFHAARRLLIGAARRTPRLPLCRGGQEWAVGAA